VAASVAAKAVIWLAMGLGFYLLPEAVRRTQGGEDARPILVRTLALLAVVAVPLVAFYALLAQPLLELVFRSGLTAGAAALPLLTAAMALLGVGYLGVQYLLALGRRSFLALLATAAAVELIVLPSVGAGSRGEAAPAQLVDVALVLLALQVVLDRAPVERGAGAPRLAQRRPAARRRGLTARRPPTRLRRAATDRGVAPPLAGRGLRLEPARRDLRPHPDRRAGERARGDDAERVRGQPASGRLRLRCRSLTWFTFVQDGRAGRA
jgi:Membrane protein involved in the export of O-antigen and teichoic acid